MPDSTEIYHRASDGQQKFDYFVTGLTGAVLSYLSQAYTPHRLTLGPESLDPFALVVLGLSFFFGFKRLETANAVMVLNQKLLDAGERAGTAADALSKGFTGGINVLSGVVLTPAAVEANYQHWMSVKPEIQAAAEKAADRALRYYHLRNWFLYAGLAAIVLSKLLLPYFPHR